MENIKIGDRVEWSTSNIPGQGIQREGRVFGVDRENGIFDAVMDDGASVWCWLDHVTVINGERVKGTV